MLVEEKVSTFFTRKQIELLYKNSGWLDNLFLHACGATDARNLEEHRRSQVNEIATKVEHNTPLVAFYKDFFPVGNERHELSDSPIREKLLAKLEEVHFHFQVILASMIGLTFEVYQDDEKKARAECFMVGLEFEKIHQIRKVLYYINAGKCPGKGVG